jgi:ubiquinone biosynthesis protein COQ9
MAKGPGRRARNGSARAGIADADRIIDAALALIAAEGWRKLSLAAVAIEAGVPILQVHRLFPSRIAVLCAALRRVDEAVLSIPTEPEAGERPRDRLFDLLMRRFDALQPHRESLETLRRDLPTDPLATIAVAGTLVCSMRLMLEAAGIACRGVGGTIAVKLVAAAYLAAAHTWARDESPDLAPTMAALDRRLRGIERWLVPVRRSYGGREPAEA